MSTIVEHFQRIPYVPGDTAARVELHSGLSRYYPQLHGNLTMLEGASRDIGLILIHPASSFLSHFLLPALARVGLPVMGLNTRYSGNEGALMMESAAADLGAGVRWMREELGFKKVVLLGFSGGGSLVSFYQSQAEVPTVTATPSGDPVDFTGDALPPADAVILCAAHAGRAGVLVNWIDPSIVDENDPHTRDPELDLYREGRTVPLDPQWIEQYRAAQRARVSRISAWARKELAEAQEMGQSDRAFVVHGTVADPRFVDLTIDPSDREIGSMYGDPRVANNSAGGLARFTTARSWLSCWSMDDTHAYAPRDLENVSVPVAVMCLMGDQAAFPSESRAMAAAVKGGAGNLIELPDLNHYLVGQEGGIQTVVAGLRSWLETKGFV